MLETERLVLREFTLEDAEAFLVNKMIKSYQDNGYGLYAEVLK